MSTVSQGMKPHIHPLHFEIHPQPPTMTPRLSPPLINITMRPNSALQMLGALLVIIMFSLLKINRDLAVLSNSRTESALTRKLQQVSTKSYRVLCTARPAVMTFGSYQIRCRDFKMYTEQWYPRITIDTVAEANATGIYDASIGCKTLISSENSTFGRLYIDIIDEIRYQSESKLPASLSVVVQNRYQAELYPNRKTFIVPHWFNSFPADSEAEPFLPPPQIRDLLPDEPLQVATIWSKTRAEIDFCDRINTTFPVNYTCMSRKYGIASWYSQVDPAANLSFINDTLRNPQLGTGYLYQHLFRQYDALIAYPKRNFKLVANSMQRVVSQMRSGVPVLVQCFGAAHEDFCESTGYTCTFRGKEDLSVLLDRLRDVSLRRQCQSEGLAIASDYSPQKIVPIFLQALGLNLSPYKDM